MPLVPHCLLPCRYFSDGRKRLSVNCALYDEDDYLHSMEAIGVEQAILRRIRLPERKADEGMLARSVRSPERSFELTEKINREPETLEILVQLYDRVVAAYGR